MNVKRAMARPLYSLGEAYTITWLALFSARDFSAARRHGLVSRPFAERIMLAVTEVNGCGICSYAHTRTALEMGMSSAEIQGLLAGSHADVPPEELPAVLFAQHYAEARGAPSREAWRRIVTIYGLPTAKGILAAARMIMWGNAYGIAGSSFINRFKGRPDERSSLVYELSLIVSSIVLVPAALIRALWALARRSPAIRFE